MKRSKFINIFLVLVLLVPVVLVHQQCSNSSESTSQPARAGGNGSGYAGIRPKGKHYAVNESTSCTNNQGQETRVSAIIDFKDNGEIVYSEGCRQEDPKNISIDELELTVANNQIMAFLDASHNFEKYDQPPLVGETINYIDTVCYVYPVPQGAQIIGELFDIQVVVRKAIGGGNVHQIEVAYSKFALEEPFPAFSLDPFDATQVDNGSTYSYLNAANPEFNLELEKPLTVFDPTRFGNLTIEIEQSVYNYRVDICIAEIL